MAAQLLLLLSALFSNIQAEVIKEAQRPHDFILDTTADFCSVWRWTTEGKKLLRNSSGSNYPLYVSHSGQYQVQCWTEGDMTLERNSTLLVCDHQANKVQTVLYPHVGQTVELTCDGVGPNQSVQWAYMNSSTNEIVLMEDGAPPNNRLQLAEDKLSPLVFINRYSIAVVVYCLEKKQLRCDIHNRFDVYVPPEMVFRSVGESVELNCSEGRGNQTHNWEMDSLLVSDGKRLNSTLMFPSLTLEHTGRYICDLSASRTKKYFLMVCPESQSAAVLHVTEGEDLTLHCSDGYTGHIHWLTRSNRTRGRIIGVDKPYRPDNLHLSGRSLVITKVSLQDSGEFWCVAGEGLLCVFRSRFLVMFGEPEVDHLLLRTVLLSVVTAMMLCVVVVVEWVMVQRSRRSEQLPASGEQLELSQLSPESDVQ